jgi:hypothetical protein
MALLLCLLAIGGFLIGGLMLSKATLGVGIIAGACLMGVLARMAQAEQHYEKRMMALSNISRQLHWRNAKENGQRAGVLPKPVRKAE